ncbi:MAG: FHA domain-containing protein, partial [bacterium]
MTAALIVTIGGRQTGKAIIEKDAFVIGRSSRCDLVLDDKNVSREHTVIVGKDGHYEIRDRGSRNSTSVNGVQLTAQTPLKDSDKIQIGPYELTFLESTSPVAPGEQDLSKTRFIDSSLPPEIAKKARSKKQSGALVYKLYVMEGPLRGESWTNWTEDLTFGRGPENQVLLQEEVVSLSHARITQTNGVFSLEDPGSSNGTFLQGVRVRSARLKHNQRIRIGSSTFLFTIVDPERKKFLLTLSAISALFMAVLVGLIAILIPADQVEPLVQQGVQFGKNGDFARAREIFQQALQLEPGNATAANYLKDVNACIEREKTLLTAKHAADNEQFD